MKLTLPCIMPRMNRRAPRGISRSDFVAPANGGTSAQSVLTVPAFLSPASRSPSLHDRATPRIRAKAKMEAGTLILALLLTCELGCLTRRDVLHLAALQQGDNSVAAVPYTIFGAPDLVGFDFLASRQHYTAS